MGLWPGRARRRASRPDRRDGEGGGTVDQALLALVAGEEDRQRRTVSLIASENYPSPTALRVLSSLFAMKMAVGYPGQRASAGCELADAVERLAKERAEKLFGAEHANVQCTSGAQANFAVYFAALRPGDAILSCPLYVADASQGGDGNVSSRDYRFLRYEIDDATGEIDYDDMRRKALRHRPRLITAGASSYPRAFDFARFRALADEAGALLHVDAAHLAGLIAGGVHPPAFPAADYVTSSTQKTLRGTRGGGLVLCRATDAEQVDRAVTPGIQSSPVVSGIAACAVALGEALQEPFRAYQEQVVRNARVLAETLAQDGFILAFGGTDTHMLVLDLGEVGLSGVEAMERLGRIGILSSRARFARDLAGGRSASGLRLGTAAATTRGMGEVEMRHLARLIGRALSAPGRDGEQDGLRSEVEGMTGRLPLFAGRWTGEPAEGGEGSRWLG